MYDDVVAHLRRGTLQLSKKDGTTPVHTDPDPRRKD